MLPYKLTFRFSADKAGTVAQWKIMIPSWKWSEWTLIISSRFRSKYLMCVHKWICILYESFLALVYSLFTKIYDITVLGNLTRGIMGVRLYLQHLSNDLKTSWKRLACRRLEADHPATLCGLISIGSELIEHGPSLGGCLQGLVNLSQGDEMRRIYSETRSIVRDIDFAIIYS